MTSAVNRIPEQNWSCSICYNLMDGRAENNGLVCISQRCMHIFHRVCVERAIEENRSCPLCRERISLSALVDNPDHAEQCQAWEADREGYTLEAAFFEKYDQTPEAMGLRAEDILRPQSLHGQPWNPEITSKEKLDFLVECIDRGYTVQEVFTSTNEFLDSIRDFFERTHRDFARIRQDHQRIRADFVKIQEDINGIREGNDQIEATYDRIEANNVFSKQIMENWTRRRAKEARLSQERAVFKRKVIKVCVAVAAVSVFFFLLYRQKDGIFNFFKNRFVQPLVGSAAVLQDSLKRKKCLSY